MLRRSLFLSPEALAAGLAPPAVPPLSPERRADDFTTRMIAQHGTVENALRATAMRVFAAEDSVASLTGQLDQYRAKLPDGAVVLPKAEAETFAKLKALGTPDEIVAGMKERGELKATVAKSALETLARTGAPVFGLDPDALADYVVTKGLAAELRDATVTENGKSVVKKVLHVRPASETNGQWKPAGDFVTGLAAHEQRALRPGPTKTPTGTPHPIQSATDTTVPDGPGDDVKAFKAAMAAQRAARPNPLVPTPATPAATP